MSNAEQTTTIRIGSVQGFGGSISVSYVPERGWVQVYANDPDDRRKAGIFVGLTDAGFQEFKTLIMRVDETIEAEIQRRLSAQAWPAGRVQNQDGCVVITLAGSNVSLPEELYKQAATLVTEGKTVLAASLINKSLTWLSLSGAKDLAQAICEHQQAKGERS